MKKKMRVASISSLALACLLISGTAAHAADGSAKYKGCTNYVKVWRDGSKVKAFGKMTCKRRTLIMRPAVVLSADGESTA